MRLVTLLFTLSALLVFSCEQKRSIIFPESDLTQSSVIPMPLLMTSGGSGFALDQYTGIKVQASDKAFEEVAAYLSEKIEASIGINPSSATRQLTYININQVEGLENNEGYELHIDQNNLTLTASSAAGAFRGIQSIRQLIPLASNDTLTSNPVWVIPTGTIKDAPQFEYRSTMLDMSRHFFSVEDVKKYLDILAYYKINTFHMHLSDDQGWRIEIKSWPKLTEVGGASSVGGTHGGFYTQEEYKDIVAYAAERFITIVPEIDMPGHTNAASLSYPFLNGNGKKIEARTDTEVGYSTLDTRKDTVYAFLDDVIRELSEITPGPYFHIGGDESHVTKKEDYIYFVERVQKIVAKYGKRMVGWDEVATAEIGSESVTQWWNSRKNADLGVAQGMQLILSPANKAYLDMMYDENSKHGLDWAALIPVDDAYNWHPEDLIDTKHILGIEAPLWSETITNISELEYLAFPRIIGYAELGWSTKENRSWEDYRKRLAHHGHFLRQQDVSYYPSPKVEW